MKILLSVGHSILKTGHCTSADGRPYGGVLEYAYNKSIAEAVKKYLQSVGHHGNFADLSGTEVRQIHRGKDLQAQH